MTPPPTPLLPSPRCRYAPSPTGSLHLGNARTALLAFLQARSLGAAFVLRIEDLDRPRTVPGATEAILDDLRWLGIAWDEGPYLQSERLDLYERALARLRDGRHVFECFCSRADLLRAASAPHAGEEGPRYPGTCRVHGASPQNGSNRQSALRLRVEPEPIDFVDEVAGPRAFDLSQSCGDFVLRRADGLFAYQLATAVDDALMGITHVLRGDDLLSSTPRQLWILRLLGQPAPRRYAHVPLLLDSTGQKLSKRLGSMTISALRERKIDPRRVVAALAHSAGLTDAARIDAEALVEGFSIGRIARAPNALDTARFPELGEG
ncbi:MAG: tRNA glutamyl-Q(34) synthetase GluQRS [Myxococcales bacterium]|jgi:glutamyl-tRNA synthetase|nr:tRNA glutamyl-Q(34) synthetase GluQRS [Myxococcales bacterium]